MTLFRSDLIRATEGPCFRSQFYKFLGKNEINMQKNGGEGA